MPLRNQAPWVGPSNTPNWAPSRPLIVSDPGKLTYFARANMIRAGVRGGYGALGGFGDDGGVTDVAGRRLVPLDVMAATEPGLEQGHGNNAAGQATDAYGNNFTFDPQTIYGDTSALGPQTSSNTESPNGTSTVDQFFSRLNSLLSPPAATPAVPPPPSPWPWLLGAAAIAAGGYFVAKKLKVI